MTVHEFITSSELEFGDMVINFCDPEFAQYHKANQERITEQVYKIISYGLFASRLIVPSRYLLQPGVTFNAVSSLKGLLEEGVLLPDLREGYSSFVEYAKDSSPHDSEKVKCAQFLDDHAPLVYSFNIEGQSSLYHEHLMHDISQDGLLRNKIDPNRELDDKFNSICETFANCEGSRKTFVNLLLAELVGFDDVIKEWAALRYYTTPAELEPRCFRDFPAAVSHSLRQNGLSNISCFIDPDQHGRMPEPMESAHRLLIALPDSLDTNDLGVLSEIVIKIREQVPRGAAKFSSLSRQGFQENVDDLNHIFQEALQRERRFSGYTRSMIPSFIEGHLVPIVISWILGISLDPLDGAVFDAGILGLKSFVEHEINRRAFPFIETTEQLSKRLQKISQ